MGEIIDAVDKWTVYLWKNRVKESALADNAPVMMWRAGPDGRCNWFNRVWLAFTGRSLEQELGGRGFLRVHRRFLVNLGRVRESEHGFKGALYLATGTRSHETVPVARRHVPQVRQALGL